MKNELISKNLRHIITALVAVVITVLVSIGSGSAENGSGEDRHSYRAFLGDSEAVHVDTVFAHIGDGYSVTRISTPMSTLARMVADKLVEKSEFKAHQGHFRAGQYTYIEEGEEPIESVLGEDNIVRISNGKTFQVGADDIVLDMGSLQHVFRFLAPETLVNKTVRVITHKRVDSYKFGEITRERIELSGKGEIDVVTIRAEDVDRPGRYSQFWLDDNQDYFMVRMKQQSEKKRPMVPDFMLLELK